MLKCFVVILFSFMIAQAVENPKLSNGILSIEYNQQMHSKITSTIPDSKELMNKYFPSEQLILENMTISDFTLDNKQERSTGLTLTGTYLGDNIKVNKEIVVEYLKDHPGFILTKVKYTNTGNNPLIIKGWINNNYNILPAADVEPAYWSFQGATYPDRRDWILPVKQGFSQENFMGMNASDYGGGTPVSDIWRPDAGFAVGLMETVQKLVSIPVVYNDPAAGASLNVTYNYPQLVSLPPGESIETYQTFTAVHEGDYFSTLTGFSKILQSRGITFQEFTPAVYESEWCAWGYERNFTIEEVVGTLPKVAEVGYKWATLDDGWQTAEGDWYLNPKRFPDKDADMKKFVDEIHNHNLKAMLWWAPLAVDSGTDLIKDHDEYLLLNKDGTKQDITWWDSYYLCPAYQPVIDYHTALVKKIMSEWGYEGLKIDGQHLNAAPPCYNKAHKHAYPEESSEKLPLFYKAIIETALSINPNAVIQICPCGTNYSFYNLPYMNQTVSSDPTSSWQIRLKGKTLKALMGNDSPYFGDHVELSDERADFASTVGVGGIVGTKFTHPTDRLEHKDFVLTPQKELVWKKWVGLYDRYTLSDAEYKGELYDIGYDEPETHAIQKGDTLFYAFYSEKWSDEVELRGLSDSKYMIIDYVNDKELGEVEGNRAKLNVNFNKFLLIKAVPVN